MGRAFESRSGCIQVTWLQPSHLRIWREERVPIPSTPTMAFSLDGKTLIVYGSDSTQAYIYNVRY